MARVPPTPEWAVAAKRSREGFEETMCSPFQIPGTWPIRCRRGRACTWRNCPGRHAENRSTRPVGVGRSPRPGHGPRCSRSVTIEWDRGWIRSDRATRIDGISALVNALTVALPAITGSVYDERPPLLVDL
jgi:hypothetical protein